MCEGTVPCWKVSPKDPEGLGAALCGLARWWADHPEGPRPPGADHPYSSLSVAKKLASFFREWVS
jgi:hypothetical protein